MTRASCCAVMLLIITLLFNGNAFGQRAKNIIQTMHNLSVSGPGGIKAVSEQEICVFCHTPHMTEGLRCRTGHSVEG